MGRKTHGPYLLAAIEFNDVNKVSDILSTKFRDKLKVKHFLVSDVRRLASEYTEVPLLLAATCDDPTIIKYFVTKHEANINHIHEYGFLKPMKRKTALIVAVRKGLYNTVDTILLLNGNVNFQDHKGRTPLHYAIRRADYRMAKLLLGRGAQVGLTDASNNSPLHIATIFGHTELVRLLLRQGGDLYKKGQHDAIPIHIAAKEGHVSLVRMFCEQYEVNVNIMVPCYDEREKAPIHVAAMEGHAEMVFTLLECCYADVNVHDSEGETPLHCVSLREYDPLGMKSKEDFTETIKVLLNYGAEANCRNARGETALHLAARNEFQKVVEVLVLAGSDPLIEDNDHNKPIDLVAPEDTVSKQTLKNAATDRERYLAEALEVRAKGFITSLQNHLPLSTRSQSTLNMPIAGTTSQRCFMPSQNSTLRSAYLATSHQLLSTSRQHQSSHSSSSSSKRRSIQSVPKLPPSLGNLNQIVHAKPLTVLRKASSLEEIDRQTLKNRCFSKQDCVSEWTNHLKHKNSYQESETTSFWSVTPPGSVRGAEEEELVRRIRIGPNQKLAKSKLLTESEDEVRKKLGMKKPEVPFKFGTCKDIDKRSYMRTESEYYLNDDDSVDMLEVEKQKKKKKDIAMKNQANSYKSIDTDLTPVLVKSWLDDQTRILKNKEMAEKSGPVAHSTPPTLRKSRQMHDDCENSESTSDNGDSSVSESGDSATTIPTKSRPVPPPKPLAKDCKIPVNTINKALRKGIPVLPEKAPSGSQEILDFRSAKYSRETVDIERVIQLEVNESYDPGETVIRVIPLTTSGQSRVHKVSEGGSLTTFINLRDDVPSYLDQTENQMCEKKQGRKKSLERTMEVEDKQKCKKQMETEGRSEEHKYNKSIDNVGLNSVKLDKKPIPKPRERQSIKSGRMDNGLENVDSSLSSSSSSVEEKVPLHLKLSPTGITGLGTAAFKMPKDQSVPFTKASRQQPTSSQDQEKLYLVFEKASVNCCESTSVPESVGEIVALENVVGKFSKKDAELDSSHFNADRAVKMKHKNSEPSEKDIKSEDSDEIDSESSEDDVADKGKIQELRTIAFNCDGNLTYTVIGGNVDGIFVHALDCKSEAAKKDLRSGDQILKANGQLVYRRTREEASQLLRSIIGPVSLVVQQNPKKYRAAVKNNGYNDSLYVRAHFSYDAIRNDDLTVRPGNIFFISDTLPDSNIGFWKVQKMNVKQDENTQGFILNQLKANQILMKQRLSHEKPEQRGGTFMQSFRRAKSVDRNNQSQEKDEKAMLLSGIVSYERVSQKISNHCRPVVILGLFCDIVIGMLVKDAPDLFEKATEDVENLKKPDFPVNVNLIRACMTRGKHCLVILSPPSIEYLLQKTDLHAIVIYLSPVSKAIVKSVKTKVAPFYNKNAGYMYEEALKFEKNYVNLFSASIPFTTDDWWFFNLKEAIKHIQNEPVWQIVTPDEVEEAIAVEINKIVPDLKLRNASQTSLPGEPSQARVSRDRTPRMPLAIDVLPEISKAISKEVLSNHQNVNNKAPKSILKPQSTSSVSSDQAIKTNSSFGLTSCHRLHSHNFDGQDRSHHATIQSHETPL